MSGNVWEWTLDHWHDNYRNAPTDGSAWIDAQAQENSPRVVRGGSWFGYLDDARCAVRGGGGPGYRDSDIGFRVVCSFPS
jgi:formylglycine-generating enzyme required for sulfatase activity